MPKNCAIWFVYGAVLVALERMFNIQHAEWNCNLCYFRLVGFIYLITSNIYVCVIHRQWTKRIAQFHPGVLLIYFYVHSNWFGWMLDVSFTRVHLHNRQIFFSSAWYGKGKCLRSILMLHWKLSTKHMHPRHLC